MAKSTYVCVIRNLNWSIGVFGLCSWIRLFYVAFIKKKVKKNACNVKCSGFFLFKRLKDLLYDFYTYFKTNDKIDGKRKLWRNVMKTESYGLT